LEESDQVSYILADLATANRLLGALAFHGNIRTPTRSNNLIALAEEVLKIDRRQERCVLGQLFRRLGVAAVDHATFAGTGVVLTLLTHWNGNSNSDKR
jgi:hypothetical protein